MQPSADRTAMHRQAVNTDQFGHDLVQGQVALGRQPLPQPNAVRGQLALGMIALQLGRKTPALAFQNDHIIHETRRHPEVPRRLPMPVPLFNECDHTTAQLDRMWLAHSDPPYLAE